MHDIYRLEITPSSTNEYSVGRRDTWTLVKNKSFEDFNEAKNYVIMNNRMHSELPRLLIDLKTQEEKDNLINRFCFSDEYIHMCRFFLGKPSVTLMKKKLQEIGISC